MIDLTDRNPRLTRERICEVALDMIDSDGLEAIAMRELAGRLGIKAGSLYHHFRNKDDLLAGVADSLFDSLDPIPDSLEWRETVTAILLQFAGLIQEHPRSAPMLIRYFRHSSAAMARVEVLSSLVGASGMDQAASGAMLISIFSLLVGHAVIGADRGLSSLFRGHDLDDSGFASGLHALLTGFAGSLAPATTT